jgi:hypothetical protein
MTSWWGWALGSLAAFVVFVTGYLMGEDSDTEEGDAMGNQEEIAREKREAEILEAELTFRLALELVKLIEPYADMENPAKGAYNCALTVSMGRAEEAAVRYVKAAGGPVRAAAKE